MQKVKGIVRKAEDLGRICLPKELRKSFNINVGTKIDIYPIDGKIVLEVINDSCVFCNGAENLKKPPNTDIFVCKHCQTDIAKL